jgi:hypothetical protein
MYPPVFVFEELAKARAEDLRRDAGPGPRPRPRRPRRRRLRAAVGSRLVSVGARMMREVA